MPEEVNHQRRRRIGTAAMSFAAAQLTLNGSAEAQPIEQMFTPNHQGWHRIQSAQEALQAFAEAIVDVTAEN